MKTLIKTATTIERAIIIPNLAIAFVLFSLAQAPIHQHQARHDDAPVIRDNAHKIIQGVIPASALSPPKGVNLDPPNTTPRELIAYPLPQAKPRLHVKHGA